MQQAGDQRLVGQPPRECPLLDRLQVLAREPDVQPPVLAERRLGVAGVASSLALAAAGGLPLPALDRLEELLSVGVNLHRRTPCNQTARSVQPCSFRSSTADKATSARRFASTDSSYSCPPTGSAR